MYNQGARYGHFVNHGSRQALMGYHNSRGRFDQQILRRIPLQEAHRPRVPPGRNAHTASYVQRTHWFPNYRRGNQRGMVTGNMDRRSNPRGHRNATHHHNQQQHRNTVQRHVEDNADVCFICGDYLQNSAEVGIHLCDGGPNPRAQLPSHQVRVHQQPRARAVRMGHSTDSLQQEVAVAGAVSEAVAAAVAAPPSPSFHRAQPPTSDNHEVEDDSDSEEMQCHFESLLEGCLTDLQSRYQNATERLQEGLSSKADEIRKIYRIVQKDKKKTKELKAEMNDRAVELDEREAELKNLKDKIEKSKRALDADSEQQTKEVSRLWQQLKDEYNRIENVYTVQKGRIKLDVGGHEFTTSVFTLTQVQDSMLAAMFSGRHEIKHEVDGSVFIDRDGTHFRYILNYLRDSDYSFEALPRSKQVLRELRNEAIFYQLPGLVQQIEKLL
ncbi:protein CROWDED NUCLEI 3 [Octopus vulgaris]|uniref:Protein CROWDED NUCLEI 3 n=2 Tax=Octopus TaxID=6643 RepID=A0AA36B840_OCTVU|nr:uncharacterized protein LOC115215506 [Octopus sinensis]CAI9729603.1 protein CROWDED NUCLEI 3 [Octopus vulgaris]